MGADPMKAKSWNCKECTNKELLGYGLEEDRIPTGWLSPTGEFFPCRPYEHTSTARDLLHDYGISKPEVELLNRGFCSISIVSFFDHGYAIGLRQHLTPEQKNFLEPYYHGEMGLSMISESREMYEYELERS